MRKLIPSLIVLALGLVGGAFLSSAYMNSEETKMIIKVTGLSVLALIFMAVGGFICYKLLTTGATIAINAASKNDQWDTRKMESARRMMEMGIRMAGKLPTGAADMAASNPDLDESWLPIIETYRPGLPAPAETYGEIH